MALTHYHVVLQLAQHFQLDAFGTGAVHLRGVRY